MTKEEWNTFFAGHWNFAGARQSKHLAMFPEELPRRLIKMFSFVGETVFDPFAGSGTTSLAAKNLDRNSVSYEINPEFIDVIKEKLNISQTDPDSAEYYFFKAKKTYKEFSKEISQLPYIFKDPHKLDKKVDIKKLQFGSKIDSDSPADREKYYTVKEIISPEIILLSNDMPVKLIGIKENPFINGRAISFLTDKIKGKKVFLKFDRIKYDPDNNLLCYLYLQNKTFINAHLIKKGLVNVDNSIEYKQKSKFLMLESQYAK